MHIGVIGAGYVGLVTGVCLADAGNQVSLVEVDKKKVKSINQGVPPIYEEGLDLLLSHNQESITATTDYNILDNVDVIFICVGTPSRNDGSIHLDYVQTAAEAVGNYLRNDWKLVVVKSTVLPGTTMKLVSPILEQVSGGTVGKQFGIAMNPEFLREGKAIFDFQHPDRIVIGVTDKKSEGLLRDLYEPYKAPILVTTPTAAEMIKYTSNALLATKISFANEIGNFCKLMDVDVYDVMAGVSMDHRISPLFLNAGVGFGGSCFPKDLQALIAAGTEFNLSMELLKAVMSVNEQQPLRMLKLLEKHVSNLEGTRIVVLGVAFKAETDDVRESRAMPVIERLLEKDANVVVYDPLASANMQQYFTEISYAESAKAALTNADGCLIMTDWAEFQNLDFTLMKRPVVIDGRRVISLEKQKGLIYEGICW